MEKKYTERQLQVIVEIAISVVIFGFGIWAVYYEFGWDIFNHPLLGVIIIYLGDLPPIVIPFFKSLPHLE